MTANRCLSEWLALLSSRSPESVFRLGLERVREVWGRLGMTPPAGRVISVAGTNGKGSCALFCESLLRASGRTVGTTLSPHLDRFNERIRIDGREATDRVICAGMAAVEAARGDVHLSYFEHAILAALCCFDASDLDTWVLEVGLGGRLDAVNIVDADVAIISSIGLEHTAWLGDTLEEIGIEKAGILRSGQPLVCGSAEMPNSVLVRAETLDCQVFMPGRDFNFERYGDGLRVRANTKAMSMEMDIDIELQSSIMPRIAPENVAAASMACVRLEQPARISSQAFHAACREVFNPGRLEHFDVAGVNIVLDLAHNPAAARFLRRQLDHQPSPKRTRAICGFLADKDAAGTLCELTSCVDHWLFVDTPGARGRSAEALAALAKDVLGEASCETHDSMESALSAAKGVSCASDRVLVFGSFTTVGQARRLLQNRSDVRPISYDRRLDR
ncbi:MAG: bifunctional folylpolyglutamate synthase/dihydrofolate synthase [Gammaproteobacteria bacterium]|nr:bifunctional folylpolyglutamate synthase/dihydrofolate synthase [Gammaproteobacteria bacterium]MCY4277402.1 bifunctional folylpolyglutamate synthase/dihydrofolate synthase [Gammaproteobacteria bacterium]MCY4323638.1 bifunctional folylpolyglutamate synthase/dihydrofolate synthase [Gammaproteobacteria bacterium]